MVMVPEVELRAVRRFDLAVLDDPPIQASGPWKSHSGISGRVSFKTVFRDLPAVDDASFNTQFRKT